MKIVRNEKINWASLLLTVLFLYAVIVAPNGKSSSCNELWCILTVKGLFAFMAYVFFELAFFYGAPLQRLMCMLLFGKKGYDAYNSSVNASDNVEKGGS